MAVFKKACVIGAGIMGQGIAAHLANARIPVLLLDIVPPKAEAGEDTASKAFRNKFSKGGLDKAVSAKPALFFSKKDVELVSVGNLEDDLDKVKDCDLVIEVVLERMDVKQQLFAKLDKVMSPGTIITSNTSGLSIAGMTEGRSAEFKKNFLVTHFFNPVRYMKLLELVAGPDTAPDTLETIRRFGEDVLGKGIVIGKDTPNFVGNRIGTHAMIGGASAVTMDIPPFMTASGNRAELHGLNLTGLKRHGIPAGEIAALRKAYRLIFRAGLTLREALERIEAELSGSPAVAHLAAFIRASERGITR